MAGSWDLRSRVYYFSSEDTDVPDGRGKKPFQQWRPKWRLSGYPTKDVNWLATFNGLYWIQDMGYSLHFTDWYLNINMLNKSWYIK